MTETQEQLTESNANVNTVTDVLPARRPNYTIEFCMFLTMMSMSLTGIAVNNIILYRTCVYSLGHSESVCSVFLSLEKNNGTQKLEEEVQKYTTFISTLQNIIQSFTPAILTLFLGVWSNRHGRKPLVVWPLFGMAMSGILLVVYSMLNNLGPWWYILTVIPYSLTGGFTIIFTGAFCYLSDVTTTEKRSLRITILEASVSAGSVVGSLLSSHVLRAVGNVYLLLIGASLNVLAYALTVIFLTESLTGAVAGNLCSVLDFKLVKEMIRECFKRRPNNGRAQILLLTFANSLIILRIYGLLDLEYMYTREKLQWALNEFTLYSAINTTISFFGGFLGIIVVQKILKISDLAFANIAFFSLIAEYVIKSLAVTTWHMYLGAGVSLFKSLSSPLLRSMLTKILPVDDIAKVFALMSAIEGICALLSSPMYNSLYKFTLSTFPASIYVLSCGICGVSIIFVGIVQFLRRNESTPYLRLNSETIED